MGARMEKANCHFFSKEKPGCKDWFRSQPGKLVCRKKMREPLMIMWPPQSETTRPQFLKKPIRWDLHEVMFDIPFGRSPLCTKYKRMR